jgi:flagellin
MPLTVGGSSNSAGFAAFQLNKSQSLLEKSLERISSGQRILDASDDPGNLAVSMKLNTAINMTDAMNINVSNALSFSESQDGALNTAGDILTRMSELRTAYDDVLATTSEKDNYNIEFQELRASLGDLMSEQFNDVSLFSETESGGMTVYTTASGSSAGLGIEMGKLNLTAALNTFTTDTSSEAATNAEALFGSSNAAGTASLGDFSTANITEAISGVASLRAESGAISSRLTFSQERLSSSKLELENAYSRIMDVDLASELTNYTKQNVQVYAASAMLMQANLNMSIVSDLLMVNLKG